LRDLSDQPEQSQNKHEAEPNQASLRLFDPLPAPKRAGKNRPKKKGEKETLRKQLEMKK